MIRINYIYHLNIINDKLELSKKNYFYLKITLFLFSNKFTAIMINGRRKHYTRFYKGDMFKEEKEITNKYLLINNKIYRR